MPHVNPMESNTLTGLIFRPTALHGEICDMNRFDQPKGGPHKGELSVSCQLSADGVMKYKIAPPHMHGTTSKHKTAEKNKVKCWRLPLTRVVSVMREDAKPRTLRSTNKHAREENHTITKETILHGSTNVGLLTHLTLPLASKTNRNSKQMAQHVDSKT